MSIIKLSGPVIGHKTPGPAKKLIVLLHGYGSSGDNLTSIGNVMSRSLPDAVFVSPNAPFSRVGYNVGRQWFSLDDYSFAELDKGLCEAKVHLSAFLDELYEAYSIAQEDTYLLGFSQGAMMAFYMALSSEKKFAGILAYSGACIWDPGRPTNKETEMLLVHGSSDDVVPVSAFYDAIDLLKKLNVKFDSLVIDGLDHSIDMDGLNAGVNFIRKN
jgi:phospholipase/carboxylesterase